MSAEKRQYKITCSEREYRFVNSESVEDAANVVLDDSLYHNAYQHYTTLDKVVSKIYSRRWYLTRLDSLSINDFHEVDKYLSKAEARRTYIASFGHVAGESAAMWGLYGKNSPFACRVTIPKDAMKSWMTSIEGTDFGRKHGLALVRLDAKTASGNKPVSVQSACFRDVMYASVSNDKEHDGDRANALSWDHVVCKKIEKEEVQEEVCGGEYSGWIKDSEWSYEQESRLCIRLSKPIHDKAISIRIPSDVIRHMKFTLSPWSDKTSSDCARRMIADALENTFRDDESNVRKTNHLIRSSTLHGALNFK